MTTFVDWLAAELEDRAWSMSELGRRAGLSHSLISEVLGEKRAPTCDFVLAVGDALGENPVPLLRLAEHLPQEPPPTEVDDALLKAFRCLTEYQKSAIARIVFDMAGVEAAGISVSGSRQAQAGQEEQNHALNHRDAVSASTQLPIPNAMAGDCNPDPYQALRRALELVWQNAPQEERGRYFLQTAIDILYEGQRASHDE